MKQITIYISMKATKIDTKALFDEAKGMVVKTKKTQVLLTTAT